MGNRVLCFATAAGLLGIGCAAISGVGDLQEVPCADGCSEAGVGADATLSPDAPGGDTTVVPPGEASVEAGGDTGGGMDATTADVTPTPEAATDSGTSVDTGTGKDAGVDTGTDAGIDTGLPPDAGTDTGGPLCPTVQGPVMVRASSYCIGSTEVTNAQYAQFLAAKGGNTSGQPAACAWNATYVPPSAWPYAQNDATVPVHFVDWCDAYAYCAWSGARLCGKIGGGTNDPGARDDAAKSQWFSACSSDGALTYPYGNTYSPTACNTSDVDAGGPVPVASMPGCVGGYPGLFDMSGNLEEWEDSCDPGDAGPGSDKCNGRGKDWQDTPGSDCTCAHVDVEPRNNAKYEMGIRCCGP